MTRRSWPSSFFNRATLTRTSSVIRVDLVEKSGCGSAAEVMSAGCAFMVPASGS